jgi:hypothetical protein
LKSGYQVTQNPGTLLTGTWRMAKLWRMPSEGKWPWKYIRKMEESLALAKIEYYFWYPDFNVTGWE